MNLARTHWIILGIFATFIVVMMLHNPEDPRKKVRKARNLVDRIAEYNQKHNRQPEVRGSATPQVRGGADTSNDIYQRQMYDNTRGGMRYNNQNGSSGSGGMSNPYLRNPNYRQQQQPDNNGNGGQQQQPGDSYYPPAPLGQPSRPHSSLDNLFHPHGHGIMLDNGTFVAFEGTRAYTLNKEGEVVPMKDGIYEAFDGRYRMLIRGGEKNSLN